MPRFLIPLFAVGTVLGFASGFHHLHEYRHERWAAEEEHLASLCAQAALNVQPKPTAAWAPSSIPAPAPAQQVAQTPAPVVIYMASPSPAAPAPAPAFLPSVVYAAPPASPPPAALPSVVYAPAVPTAGAAATSPAR